MPPSQDYRTDMDLLVWIVLGSLLAAAGAFFIARTTGTETRKLTTELQAKQAELDAKNVELEAKQGELDSYRLQVFEQFDETAQKFKTLNESYVDLHRHLAKSANLLCGDADNLLAAPLAAEGAPILAGDQDDDGRHYEILDDPIEVVDQEVVDDIVAAEPFSENVDVEPSEIPTLDISQAFTEEESVDNAHWEAALDVVLDKLRQPPRESMDEADEFDEAEQGADPLRNAG